MANRVERYWFQFVIYRYRVLLKIITLSSPKNKKNSDGKKNESASDESETIHYQHLSMCILQFLYTLVKCGRNHFGLF